MSVEVTDSRRFSFFIVDNEIIDNYNLSPNALLAYVSIARCSNKGVCSFPLDHLAKQVGLSRTVFSQTLPELEKARLLKITRVQGERNVYELLPVNKTTRSESERVPVPNPNYPRSESELPPVQNPNANNTNKQNYYNKTETLFPVGNISDEVETIPEWIPKEAWDGFVEMRKKIKAPLTQKAVTKTISELGKLRRQGYDPGEVLDQSTMLAWRGVFPLRGGPTAVPEKRTMTASERARAGIQ